MLFHPQMPTYNYPVLGVSEGEIEILVILPTLVHALNVQIWAGERC